MAMTAAHARNLAKSLRRKYRETGKARWLKQAKTLEAKHKKANGDMTRKIAAAVERGSRRFTAQVERRAKESPESQHQLETILNVFGHVSEDTTVGQLARNGVRNALVQAERALWNNDIEGFEQSIAQAKKVRELVLIKRESEPAM